MQEIPKIPKLNFSKWHEWDGFRDINDIYSGIYAIAISNKTLHSNRVNYNDIVYIGMSNSMLGIKGRLTQLNNAIHGKYGHSGGKSMFNDLGNYKKWNKKLFVSVMPIECDVKRRNVDDLINMGVVTCLEYMAFAKFKKITGDDKPKYNTQ